jgi:hypothetical protein
VIVAANLVAMLIQVVVVPVFDSEPDTGFGVDLGDDWAAPGLVTSMRKVRLGEPRRHIDVRSSPMSTTCSSRSSQRRTVESRPAYTGRTGQ